MLKRVCRIFVVLALAISSLVAVAPAADAAGSTDRTTTWNYYTSCRWTVGGNGTTVDADGLNLGACTTMYARGWYYDNWTGSYVFGSYWTNPSCSYNNCNGNFIAFSPTSDAGRWVYLGWQIYTAGNGHEQTIGDTIWGNPGVICYCWYY